MVKKLYCAKDQAFIFQNETEKKLFDILCKKFKKKEAYEIVKLVHCISCFASKTNIENKKYFIHPMLITSAVIITYATIRSGNSSIILPGEKKLRDLLTELLYIRPRFKEVFIGWPAFIISFIILNKNLLINKKIIRKSLDLLNKKKDGYHLIKFFRGYRPFFKTILELAVIFLPVSVINSFCHFHTPVKYTIERTLTGIFLGSLSGLLMILSLHMITEILSKLSAFHKNHPVNR